MPGRLGQGWGISTAAGGRGRLRVGQPEARASDPVDGRVLHEVWATPANRCQTNAYIVTYSGDNTSRNMTLGQHAMQYEARTRHQQNGQQRDSGAADVRDGHVRTGVPAARRVDL